jgi:hypothetical protein
MTPSLKGRQCDTCSKTVVDFTVMNNQQIIDTLTKGDKICGMFTRTQLLNINQTNIVAELNKASWWKRIAVAATILWSISACKNPVLGEPLVTHQIVINKNGVETSPAIADSVTYIIITGKVLDKDDKLPLAGVTISVPDTQIGSFTDKDGNFTLKVLSTVNKLRVSFVGYQSQEIKMKNLKKNNYNIVFKLEPMVLGEVVIERQY